MSLSHVLSVAYQKNICLEFTRLVKRYTEAKEYLKNGYLLDAYHSIYEAIHHWAHLAVMEAGEHPETTLWEQIKDIDPSVYKVYEEFVLSAEPLDKRIELLLLALDFSVLSRMESSSRLIIDILKGKPDPWSVAEILEHPSIADQPFDISLLLEKMVKRSLIKETVFLKDGLPEKYYSI